MTRCGSVDLRSLVRIQVGLFRQAQRLSRRSDIVRQQQRHWPYVGIPGPIRNSRMAIRTRLMQQPVDFRILIKNLLLFGSVILTGKWADQSYRSQQGGTHAYPKPDQLYYFRGVDESFRYSFDQCVSINDFPAHT